MKGYFTCTKSWDLNGVTLFQFGKNYKGTLKKVGNKSHLKVKCENGATISFYSGSEYFNVQ